MNFALIKEYPDWIKYAREKGVIDTFTYTNGMLLTAARVQLLVEAGALTVDVSLYGATPQTHDAFTCREGSFAKTIEGIDNALEAGMDVHVNMCLVRSNAHEIGRMIELVETRGVSCGVSPFITARYDGTSSSLDERVDRATLEALYQGPLKRFISKPDFDPKPTSINGRAIHNLWIYRET